VKAKSAAMREDISIKIQNTRILPLRWLANYLFEPLSMKFFDMGLRRHDLLENMKAEDKIFQNDFRLKLWWRLYDILGRPYMRWGTLYQLDMVKLKEEFKDMDLSGEEWNDYDQNGHPYWYFTEWQEDPETGDAWRLIKK